MKHGKWHPCQCIKAKAEVSIRQAGGGDTETNPTARRSWLSSKTSRESRKMATALAQHMGKNHPHHPPRGQTVIREPPPEEKKTSQSSRTSAGHGNQTAPDVSSSSNGTPPTDQYKKEEESVGLSLYESPSYTHTERGRERNDKKKGPESSTW